MVLTFWTSPLLAISILITIQYNSHMKKDQLSREKKSTFKVVIFGFAAAVNRDRSQGPLHHHRENYSLGRGRWQARLERENEIGSYDFSSFLHPLQDNVSRFEKKNTTIQTFHPLSQTVSCSQGCGRRCHLVWSDEIRLSLMQLVFKHKHDEWILWYIPY